jgi:hypothetical protein
MIHTTKKLEVAVWEVTRQIPGLIETRSRLGAKGIGEKCSSSQRGTVEVPASQAGPPDIEFPGHTNGHGLALAVEYIDLRVGDRTTNRHAYRDRALPMRLIAGHIGGIFGGSIQIDQATVWHAPQKALIEIGSKRYPTDKP